MRTQSDVVLSGDINCFPFKSDTSNTEKKFDVRIKSFEKLKPLLDDYCLHDMAELNNVKAHTHFDKKNGFSSRLDFVSSTNMELFNGMNVIPNPFSDHSIVH